MCGVQLKDGKRSNNLMLMFGLIETIDQTAMANSVHWYGHVLRIANTNMNVTILLPKALLQT